MRLGSLFFLLLGLFMLSLGVWYLYVRFVAGPEPHLKQEDIELHREFRDSQPKLEANVKVADVMVTKLREEAEKVPKDDPEGKRAKLDEALAKAETHQRQSTDLLTNSRKFVETYDKLIAIRDENSTAALRRGILFTLLGAVWSLRAAMSLRAKPTPS